MVKTKLPIFMYNNFFVRMIDMYIKEPKEMIINTVISVPFLKSC